MTNPAHCVIHDTKASRFVLPIDGQEVVVKYKMNGESNIDFYSTFTPESLRGRGYAAQAVEQALEYARENKFQVKASCWYVRKFLNQNPQFRPDNTLPD